MAYSIDTKPNLSGFRFEQCVGDTLVLSGCTDIRGKFEVSSGGTLSVLPNRGTNKMLISDSNGNITLQQEIPQSNVTNLTSDLAGKASKVNFNLYTGTTAPATYVPYAMINDSKTYTGFIDPANVTISYNWSGRTITLSGNLTYMWKGVEHTLTSPWTSSGHTTSTGNWYLASTDGINFVWGRSMWNFYEIAVASVNYKATSVATFGNRESHGLMDWRVHEELHHTIGTWLSSGGLATAGSYTENLATDAAVSPSFDAALIEDEDLSTTIPLLNKANGYTLMNIGTGSTSVYTLGATRPFLSAGANQYIYVNNVLTGAMTAGVNARWYNVYQILVPVTSDVNSQKYRMVLLQPQVTFISLAAAQAEDTRGLSLGNLSTSSGEFVLYARISYLTSNANSNYGRVTIPTGGITYVVGTRMSQVTVNGISASNHANLSNLNWVDSGHIGANSSVAAFDSVGNATTILQSAFTPTANNGLNIIGTNVRLGGALTGNTTITGAYTLNICNSAQLNTALGYQISGVTILRTSPNTITSVFIGCEAGNNTSTGINNTAIGRQALYKNTTGSNNTAFGYQALYSNTGGTNNTAIGNRVLYFNTTGSNNTASGRYALCANTTGNNNIATGDLALHSNTTGSNNTAFGCWALQGNTTGCNNTASGYNALFNNTTGCNNIAFGHQTLYINTCGSNNTASGNYALRNNTSGSNNFASGYGVLYNNSTGCNNIAFGCNALCANSTGCNNIAFGNQALCKNTTGKNNTASGYQSLMRNTTGCNNIASGYQSLKGNTTGCNNIASGYQALSANTTGCHNIALGYSALNSNTTGCNNIANGYQALYSNISGLNNIANGYYALYNNTIGNNNIALGYQTLYCNITGCNNIINGYQAGYLNVSGSSNVFIGQCAGYNETNSNKLYIANNATTSLISGDFSTGNVKISNSLTICKGIYTYGENLAVNIGTCVVAQALTACYTGMFFDYVINNTSVPGLRSGTVTTVTNGVVAVYNEVTSGDIGDTSQITLCVDVSGSYVRLLATASTNDWTVKAIVRGI